MLVCVTAKWVVLVCRYVFVLLALRSYASACFWSWHLWQWTPDITTTVASNVITHHLFSFSSLKLVFESRVTLACWSNPSISSSSSSSNVNEPYLVTDNMPFDFVISETLTLSVAVVFHDRFQIDDEWFVINDQNCILDMQNDCHYIIC